MVVDGVGEELEADAVARAVVAAGVAPAGGDEEVGVDGFVEERVDCVGAGAVLQERGGEFEADARELSCCRGFGEFTYAGAAVERV